MMKRRFFKLKRSACLALAALTLAFCVFPPTVRAETPAEKKQQLEKEYQQAQQELKKYQNNKEKAQEEKQTLENQKAILEQQIGLLVDEINEKLAAIAQSEQAIAEQQADIDARWDDFKARMQAMQIMHDSGAVAMISSAKSLYDLLTYTNTLQQVAGKDTQVLEEMKARQAALEQEKQAQEQAKADLEASKTELEEKTAQLSEGIQRQEQNISKADADAKAQAAVTEELQKKLAQAQREMDAWVRRNSSSGSGVISAARFIWPLTVTGRITQRYGENGHSGLDIAAPSGTPILAAHAGQVYATTGDWSYGNVVMLDNGDGVTTLYAHMSSIAVGVGQQVSQGDVIGYVGNTGRSQGYHLHLEVRSNGARQNPQNYL